LAGLVQAGLVQAAAGIVLSWVEVAKGLGGQEAAMSRLDFVRIEIGHSIPHKPDYGHIVFV